ncbi:DHS-like NAD/FAD-binding domain-containing protein [Halteromyces radiatus]|uniref:DHS-like NAD/FAD-binding domain-containing protein n=1 Tax=Halteromyces radiatus TaxID=101107 RepID=UPI0022204640|nr:DHS-like NAD/FAD-binding domain-containing protein [Halteromyces radiatus]KAI8100184.1 DHS-like NAD/FAD-binding domain-containing protein [Halteromyces radiatus]
MKVRFSTSDPPEVIDPYIADLAACISRSKRTVVITGAGISCNSGIPDFRSSDGLYNLVKKKHPDTVLRGKELFDATLFKDVQQTRCFYTFMAELKTLINKAQPTATHNFISNMKDKGQLLRCYTQNIDCLEDNLDQHLVQLHGTMDKVQCTLCSSSYEFTTVYQDQFRSGAPPLCPKCETNENERQRLGKRSLAMGTLRPAVVLYNEEHPNGEAIGLAQATDIKKRPDLLIVMGTSLKIVALKKFIKQMAKSIHINHPRTGRVIFINKTKPTKEWDAVFDYEVIGDADTWVNLTEEKLLDTKALAAAKVRLREAIKREEDELAEDKENIDVTSQRRKRTTTTTISRTTKTTITKNMLCYATTKKSTVGRPFNKKAMQ